MAPGRSKREPSNQIPELSISDSSSKFSPYFEYKMSKGSLLTRNAQIQRELTRRKVVLDDEKWNRMLEMVRESKVVTHTAVQEVLNRYIMANIALETNQQDVITEDTLSTAAEKNAADEGTGWLNSLFKKNMPVRDFDGMESKNNTANNNIANENRSKFLRNYSKPMSTSLRSLMTTDTDDHSAMTRNTVDVIRSRMDSSSRSRRIPTSTEQQPIGRTDTILRISDRLQGLLKQKAMMATSRTQQYDNDEVSTNISINRQFFLYK